MTNLMPQRPATLAKTGPSTPLQTRKIVKATCTCSSDAPIRMDAGSTKSAKRNSIWMVTFSAPV